MVKKSEKDEENVSKTDDVSEDVVDSSTSSEVENSKDAKKKTSKKKKDEEEDMKLSDLPGVGPAAIEKLEAAGIFDLMGIAVLGPKELAQTAGLGEAVARKAIQASRKMMDLGFQDGLEFAQKREEIFYITTGSKEFDGLLGGRGVETKAITEAFGSFGSGKCVTKDTPVSYFNDSLHLETIEKVYNKYNDNNEFSFEGGSAIPIKTVKVMCFDNGVLEIKPASHVYKEKVKKIFEIKTARGRTLRVTGNHQFLSFDNGFKWDKAGFMKQGNLIAYPKKLNLKDVDNTLSEDDAYFLGFFVAEGTSNPFSVCNNNQKVINWIVNYIKNKYNYSPTVRVDNRREKPVKTVLLRNITRDSMFKLDKSNSSNKFIPEIIFNSDENIIKSFLAGYLEGDAEIADNILTATTKSKTLASQLNYLFLRLGMSSSMNKRIVDDKTFYNIYIVGEDREKINNFPFKFKTANYQIVNSKYGYPRQVIDFLRESYKKSLGGCRGRTRKKIGKRSLKMNQAYRHLTREFICININEKSFREIKNIFIQGDNLLNDLIRLLNGKFDTSKFKEVVNRLPFAVNSLAEKINLNKKSIQNYYLRKLPDNKKEIIKNLLIEEILNRKEKIVYALKIINSLENFGWDWITNIKEVDYNDYVYDFVVPEGHSFIGGDMPTMMHNTQLGLSLAVNAQLPIEQGGAEGKAVYIDTEGTFRPERIKQIAEAKGANPENVLKNILVARAFNSDHQILLIDKIGELIKNGEPVRIVIVDSLTAHFRAEFSGRGQLADRQQKLNKYLHNLMKMAEQFNLAVYVTNQVMANPAMMFGDPTTAIGGNIVGHASTYRIYIRRGKKGSRVAKLIDSPNLPDNECMFFVSDGGVVDEE